MGSSVRLWVKVWCNIERFSMTLKRGQFYIHLESRPWFSTYTVVGSSSDFYANIRSWIYDISAWHHEYVNFSSFTLQHIWFKKRAFWFSHSIHALYNHDNPLGFILLMPFAEESSVSLRVGFQWLIVLTTNYLFKAITKISKTEKDAYKASMIYTTTATYKVIATKQPPWKAISQLSINLIQ